MSKSSDFWAAHLSAIDAEGITKKVYALRHGLSLKRMYYWRGRLNRPRADEGTQHRAVTSSCPAPRQFVAVQVKETAPEALPCILILGPSVRLELTQLPAPQWLAALGRAVHEQAR